MRVFAVLFLMLTGTAAMAQPSVDVIDYINKYKQLAMDEMQRTGIPASITLAQGVHETYAGKSELVLKSNNHFGIKCKSYWTGKKVYHDDDARGECFRSYDSAVLSYRDHSDFLKGSERYASLFALEPTDYKAWATGLRKAGYATNPKYAPILIKLIEEYNLQQYTLIAMGKLSPAEEVVVMNPKPATNTPPVEVVQEVIPEKPAEEILPADTIPTADTSYPEGEFTINNTRVTFVRQGTALLSIAQQFDIPLNRLMEYNGMKNKDIVEKDQLIYLQKRRKSSRPKP